MNELPLVRLRKDKEFMLLRGHPWIYAQAVHEVEERLATGTVVRLITHKGWELGLALLDRDSPILLRLLAGSVGTTHDDFDRELAARLTRALELRERLFAGRGDTDCYRLVYGEGDGLPGLVIDRYGDGLVMQTYSAGWQPHVARIVQLLLERQRSARWVYQRHHVRRAAARDDGAGNGSSPGDLLHGTNLPERLVVRENGLQFVCDPVHGQKTGLFLDQRDNRALIRDLARDRTVLNLCAYNGAFTVYALAGGARRVVSVDLAGPALDDARENCRRNGFTVGERDFVKADMVQYLERSPDGAFDLVIVDPPSMARSRAEVDRACQTYYKLNRLALAKVADNGLVFTASCSSQIDRDRFLTVVADAAAATGRTAQLLHEAHHPADHPIPLGFAEGRYLHGLLVRVTGTAWEGPRPTAPRRDFSPPSQHRSQADDRPRGPRPGGPRPGDPRGGDPRGGGARGDVPLPRHEGRGSGKNPRRDSPPAPHGPHRPGGSRPRPQ